VKLDIATDRKSRDLPAGAVPVHPAGQHRPHADREHIRLDAGPAPDQVVSHFVNEDDDAQRDDERDDGQREVAE
jgi:hypothetical protein